MTECSRNGDGSEIKCLFTGEPEKEGEEITLSKREKPRYPGCLRSLGERRDWKEEMDLCPVKNKGELTGRQL